MRRPRSLSFKLTAIGGALLLLVLVSIGLTLSVSWQLEGGAAAVNEAGRLRMKTWQLAMVLSHEDRAQADALAADLDRGLALLRAGDPQRPLFVPRDDVSQDRLHEVADGWQALQLAWSGTPPAAPERVAQAGHFVARVDTLVSAMESRLSALTEILYAFQLGLLALALGTAVALLYAAHLLIFNPLTRLQAGLTRLASGELAARVDVATDDEFGEVAAGFNRMAQALQGLYQGLEAKVHEKTLGLQARHAQLAALYEAAAFVSRADTLDELAQGFARQLRRVAGADATAVRWSDEDNRRYLLLASDCLPAELTEAEHCVRTGDCHCGQAQARAGTRVIPIQADDGDRLGHCRRAGFETVIGVPLRLHDRMVGEIDLFYRHEVTLGDDERALLEALASHLAGAIEALRAEALHREAAVAEERGLLARELHDSIAQSLAFLKIQAGLLRQALARQDAAQVERTLGELDAGVHESLADVRELLLHFRTRTNAEDIVPALRSTLHKFELQTGLTTHLTVDGDGLPLDPDVQVQVLHVVQEALSNVRKHAGARAVWVEVQQAPHWRVEVRDDGRGLPDEAEAADETHVGLRIMRERAQRIGADVALHSVPGAGTSVVLSLPERRAAVAEPEPA
jgi:two-component system, NarL family, nitrate/nitrite sensor histidine kinase NarX